MDYQGRMEAWLADETIDELSKQEILDLKKKGKEAELEDRFYTELSFGTGGLRGIMGAGTNRMNRYTVRKATQGLAYYLLSTDGEAAKGRGVVIAYDSRRNSDVFAEEAALVLNANGFVTYLFESLRPTPELSFSVRELGAGAGIVITASHNPPEYNGYKVYGADGGQVVPDIARKIMDAIQEVPSFAAVCRIDREEAVRRGLFHILGEEMDQAYLTRLEELVLRPEAIDQAGRQIGIVYTPLHGSGALLVQRILQRVGFEGIYIVEEQERPDPNFSTVKSPNPEEKEAFTLAIEKAKLVDADLMIGTDPDADRVGVVVKNKAGDYVALTGNQTGALLLEYVLSTLKEKGRLPQNGVVIKTIVTGDLGRKIAEHYGVEIIETLTGFKYICGKIAEFEKRGDRQFLFGYEESYGYLAAPFVRDKDGVMASLLICEMAAYHLQQGRSLYEALMGLFEKYGVYLERLESVTLEGKEGVAQIQANIAAWREQPPLEVADLPVVMIEDVLLSEKRDFLTGTTRPVDLPKENVLKFWLKDGSWFCLRPSGTEPKLKIYFSVSADTQKEAQKKLDRLVGEVMKQVREPSGV